MEEHEYTLAEWTTHWVEIYKKRSVGESAWKIYISTILPRIADGSAGCKRLSELEEDDLQILLNELAAKGYRASVLVKVRNCLRASLHTASRQGLVGPNLMEDIHMPRAATKKVLPFTHTEEDCIRKACSQAASGYLIEMLLGNGAARGSLNCHLKCG